MRILILTEDADLCEELSELLQSEGHHVTTATDAFRAARLALEKRHDLLLLELMIPGVKTVELYEMLKRRNPLLKTCLITEDLLSEMRPQESILSLVDAVIRKPILPELLLEKVSALAA